MREILAIDKSVYDLLCKTSVRREIRGPINFELKKNNVDVFLIFLKYY